MAFVRRDGIFKQLCDAAQADPEHNFYLIIDEINRGDVPRIFGELLTVLEKDKRGKAVLLPLSETPFQVPKNVYLIGTMNTADRSIALLDTALRRRFGFIELMPDYEVLRDPLVGGDIPLAPWLEALNRRILEHVGRDARNLQIGHAYLLDGGKPVSNFARFSRVVQEDIIPLLEEYCYEDYTALEKILGRGLVNAVAQEIKHDLFDPARQDELVQALLAPSPEITTSLQAAVTEEPEPDEGEEDNNVHEDE
jgi:5-methylcytosine-specific restriction protein B